MPYTCSNDVSSSIKMLLLSSREYSFFFSSIYKVIFVVRFRLFFFNAFSPWYLPLKCICHKNGCFVLFFAGLVYVIRELRTKQLSKNDLRVLSSSKRAKFRVKWDSVRGRKRTYVKRKKKHVLRFSTKKFLICLLLICNKQKTKN